MTNSRSPKRAYLAFYDTLEKSPCVVRQSMVQILTRDNCAPNTMKHDRQRGSRSEVKSLMVKKTYNHILVTGSHFL